MASGYTRVFSKSTGNTILASDFNSEFQLIDDAFSEVSGHKHDGSTNEGAYVPKISDTNNYTAVEIDAGNAEIDFNINVSSAKVRQMVLVDGALLPDTDNDVDLGSATYEFKNLYIDGIANIDSLVADTADINGGTFDGVVGGTTPAAGTFTTLVANGNTTLGDAITDSITFTGRAASDFNPITTDTYDLGSASLAWELGYINHLYAESLNLESTSPSINLYDTNAATDEKRASLNLNTGRFDLSFSNDAQSGAVTAFTIDRTGYDNIGPYTFLTGNAVTTVYIENDGTICFGNSTPHGVDNGSLTISTGDSGVSSWVSGADELIIEGSGSTVGMTIAFGDGDVGEIFFLTPSSFGAILYNDTSNIMQFYVNDDAVASLANGASFQGLYLESGMKFWITTPQTPASASATGSAGQIAWDTNYIYVCTASNTWKRSALSTW